MATISSNNKNNTTNPLKRKRPPKLEIPKVLQEIEKGTANCDQNDGGVVCYTGNGFCVSSVKGKKKFMEDTHKVVSCSGLKGLGYEAKGFFGVYDGHGGKKAAEFVAENLHTNILEMLKNSVGDDSKEDAVKAAYLKTDKDFLNQGLESGACCVTALIKGTDLVVSNLGDCRVVLSRSGIAEALTKDHSAEREDEKRRIEENVGYVEYHKGAWRVHGVLSVSRSIGDAHLKEWVIAEPDTQVLHMTPDMDFLVLASDGLWNEVGNQEAVDTVTQYYMEKNPRLASGLKLDSEDHDDFGCVNVSPPSKIRKVSLVKQPKATTRSPSKKSIVDNIEDSLYDANCENKSPLLNKPRISVAKRGFLVKQPKATTRSPSKKSTVDNIEDSLYDANCENKSPLLNTPKISVAKRGFLVKQQKSMTPSPSKKQTVDNIKDGLYGGNCENEIPSLNTPRTSLAKQVKAKPKSPSREDIGYSQDSSPAGLLAACKELVKLAVSRGCLDDITVIIVDLNHFKCNS